MARGGGATGAETAHDRPASQMFGVVIPLDMPVCKP